MNDFDDVGVGEDDVKSVDIDAEGVDEKCLVVAADLDEAELVVEKRRLDVEADERFLEDMVDGASIIGFALDHRPGKVCMHHAAVAAFEVVIIHFCRRGRRVVLNGS